MKKINERSFFKLEKKYGDVHVNASLELSTAIPMEEHNGDDSLSVIGLDTSPLNSCNNQLQSLVFVSTFRDADFGNALQTSTISQQCESLSQITADIDLLRRVSLAQGKKIEELSEVVLKNDFMPAKTKQWKEFAVTKQADNGRLPFTIGKFSTLPCEKVYCLKTVQKNPKWQ